MITVVYDNNRSQHVKTDVRSPTALEEATGQAEILASVYTTGEVGSGIVE